MKEPGKKKKSNSIIIEVAILFLIGIVMTGFLMFSTETTQNNENVRKQTEDNAAGIADQVKAAVREFPAYQWLIRYWYEHADTMDIEYDAEISEESRTAEKCRVFMERNPSLRLKYLTPRQCVWLSEEDQKLYAEIAYSWLITEVDNIKRSFNVAFLFCVVAEEPYDKQFFLFSAADPGAVRGTSYEEVYPLGHVVTVAESQTAAMREALRNFSHLAEAGDYVDYYSSLLLTVEGRQVLIGLTYDLSELKADIRAQTRVGMLLATLNMLVLSLVCIGLILLFVLRPLRKVQNSIRNYKETKDSATAMAELAKIHSTNEIGRLAQDVSALAGEMDDYIDRIGTISAERERIGAELSLAAQIQADMLPNTFPAFPDRPEFNIYASMDPAKEIGGDFYDFFLVDEDHLCLVIADVSGKGIPAALFMMASKIILANSAMMGRSPGEILTQTNAAICANNREEMFVTVWLGILELSTGKLTAANAGHEYPILRRPGEAFERYPDKHGFILGGMDKIKYKEYELTLEPGSRLFVYTDGVLESMNADKEQFGEKRLLVALNEVPDAEPEEILRHVRSSVDGFVKEAEQFDDLTMLCVEYKGAAKA